MRVHRLSKTRLAARSKKERKKEGKKERTARLTEAHGGVVAACGAAAQVGGVGLRPLLLLLKQQARRRLLKQHVLRQRRRLLAAQPRPRGTPLDLLLGLGGLRDPCLIAGGSIAGLWAARHRSPVKCEGCGRRVQLRTPGSLGRR